MKKFALIGSGIAGSLSPALFKAAYAGKWEYGLLDGPSFAPLLERFKAEYDAVNVTAPFKEEAYEAADFRTEEAELCGAANILLKDSKGRITADNSDFEGVTLSLMSAYAVSGVDVDDEDAFDDFLLEKTALVVGCGGAGKAAAAACITMGYGKTILINRTRSKADALARRLKSFYGDVSPEELEVRPWDALEASFEEADAVIWAIPGSAGMKPAFKAAQETKLILEADYKTPALEGAGGNYVSGLNWLMNQAVIGFESLTGQAPDEDALKEIQTI